MNELDPGAKKNLASIPSYWFLSAWKKGGRLL